MTPAEVDQQMYRAEKQVRDISTRFSEDVDASRMARELGVPASSVEALLRGKTKLPRVTFEKRFCGMRADARWVPSTVFGDIPLSNPSANRGVGAASH